MQGATVRILVHEPKGSVVTENSEKTNKEQKSEYYSPRTAVTFVYYCIYSATLSPISRDVLNHLDGRRCSQVTASIYH
jgi:hypothetical protein